MANWDITQQLDARQQEVFALKTSKVIKGCAGSGKTLMAAHLAKRLQEQEGSSFYFIVYTKALKAFIGDGIRQLGIENTKVMYAWEWQSRYNAPSADYILVDEAQDFSEEDILLFKSKARKEVFFFGDSAQQIYDVTMGKNPQPCISIESIEKVTNLDHIQLQGNKRLYPSIAKLAQLVNIGENIENNCTKQAGNKPQVKYCKSEREQLDWIVSQITDKGLEDVAILIPHNLVPENKGRQYSGVFETYQYLRSQSIKLGNQDYEIGYRYSKDGRVDEQLRFSKYGIDIMPYHSSKGLQYKNVFLPFYIAGNRDTWQNAFFVALTRTSENLYLTCEGNHEPFLTKALNQQLVQLV